MPNQSKLFPLASTLLIALIASSLAPGQTLDPAAQTPEEAQLNSRTTFQDAVDAYIYGYPLVMFGITERVFITVPPDGNTSGHAPLNQFGKEPSLPTSAFTTVVLPSTTTLYASSFLNLKAEPVILHIPNFKNRFFLLQMLDGWTNVNEKSPGTRQGSKEGDYALVGPDWNESLPPSIPWENVIRMDTNSMWIIGRIYTKGTEQDVNFIKENIYPGLTLTPLSSYGKDYAAPSELPPDPSIETSTPPLQQVAGMDACAFFGTFATMMKYNAPLPADGAITEKLEAIGIVPGKPFDCTTLRPKQPNKLAALQAGVRAARTYLLKPPTLPTSQTNFWLMPLNVGTYGTDYSVRAQVAKTALGANLPTDAVYGYGTFDGRGVPLSGSNRYAIHFRPKTAAGNPGEIPPVNSKAFWSVTIYNKDGTLVANDVVNYNAIGIPEVQGHQACFNPDHSLDLYLQPNAPSGKIQFCNWLPIPDGKQFIVFLRMYWPDNAVLSGKWVPPAIERVR